MVEQGWGVCWRVGLNINNHVKPNIMLRLGLVKVGFGFLELERASAFQLDIVQAVKRFFF